MAGHAANVRFGPVMPGVTPANTNVPAIMIAEKRAAMILQDARTAMRGAAV